MSRINVMSDGSHMNRIGAVIASPYKIQIMQNNSGYNEYLVLLLTAKHYKIFHGSNNKLEKIKTHVPEHVAAYSHAVPEKTANFSNSQDRKEVMLDKFVYHADEGLDEVLRQYHLPVFLLATERVAGHFMKSSHHAKSIKAFVHGNYEHATVSEMLDVLAPHIAQLDITREQILARKIANAADEGKFSFGFENVKRNAKLHKGCVLILEKEHEFTDAVEMVIKDVVESGGNVVFAERKLMNKYDHIGLVQYY